jgi:hypothetical protein
MLRWSSLPDQVFTALVDAALECAIDMLGDLRTNGESDEESLSNFRQQTRALFTSRDLDIELRKLLSAHRSTKFYMPTDYHFLLLYDVLNQWIEQHNESVASEGKPFEYGELRVGEVDFDFAMDHYFWDEDFLLDPEMLDCLSSDQKGSFGLSAETFGVTHELKPHPKELELVESAELPESEGEELYQRGKPYPAF